MSAERLQKILARAGLASRRAAEEMILAGRVTVNGEEIRILGSKVEGSEDIRVDGNRVVPVPTRCYLMVHKPAGYVTTLADPQGRPTVRDLVASLPERLYPVGRLDFDSEGLLLMTNDGDFAYQLQHPGFGVPKTYRVKVVGQMAPADIRKLETGIEMPGGRFKPLSVEMEGWTRNSSWLRLTIDEGRNRIIRRVLDRMDFPVRRLVRVEIGGVSLGTLKRGEFRELTAPELETLRVFIKNSLDNRSKINNSRRNSRHITTLFGSGAKSGNTGEEVS